MKLMTPGGKPASTNSWYIYQADSIAVLAIDPTTGRLSLQQTVPCGGRTPRFFALHPSGRWLYVLNEDSDTIVPMAVDAAGHLTPCAEPLHCGSPVCLTFV